MHRTFILHAKDSKLPTDLLGFTCVRYGESVTPSETKAINQKLRKAIPLLGQSFDCFLRPDFDVVEYRADVGVGGLINQIASARTLRKESERQIA